MHQRPMVLGAGFGWLVFTAAICAAGGAVAQGDRSPPPPLENGNRANGFSYQPTQPEVGSREKAAGIAPSAAQRDANGQVLQNLDKNLLHQYGLSTKSVPNLTAGQ